MQIPERMNRRTFLVLCAEAATGLFLSQCKSAAPQEEKPPIKKRMIDGDGWDITELAPGVVDVEADIALSGRKRAAEEGLGYVADRCDLSAVSRDPGITNKFIVTLNSSDKD